MKKFAKIMALVMIASCLISFGACGSGSGNAPTTPSTSSEASQTSGLNATESKAIPDAVTDNTKIKVFLLAGQSNSVGVTNTSEFADEFKSQFDMTEITIDGTTQYENDDVLFYTDGEMGMSGTNFIYGNSIAEGTYAYAPYCREWRNVSTGFGINKNSFGPEIGMANVLGQMYPKDNTATPYNVAIIKYAFGGTGLAELWLSESGFPTYYPNTQNGRSSTYNNKPVGLLYANFMNTVENAMRGLIEMGYQPEVEGMAWMQGCNDAWGSSFANIYEEMLQCMVDDVRANMVRLGYSSNANLPVAIGEIGITISIWSDKVREEQKSLCDHDANCHFVSTKDLKLKVDDWWHFDSPSQYQLGRRFASKLFFESETSSLRNITSAAAITLDNSTGTTYTLPQFAECTMANGKVIPCEVTWSAYTNRVTSTGTTQVQGTVYGGKSVTANVVTNTDPILDGKLDDLIWSTRVQVSLRDNAGSYVVVYPSANGLYLGARVNDVDVTCWQDASSWYRFINHDQVAFYLDSTGNTSGSFGENAIGVFQCAINVASVYPASGVGTWGGADAYRTKNASQGYYGKVKHNAWIDGKNASGDWFEGQTKTDKGYELEIFVPYECFGATYETRSNIRINAGRVNITHAMERSTYTIGGGSVNGDMFESDTLDRYFALSRFGSI